MPTSSFRGWEIRYLFIDPTDFGWGLDFHDHSLVSTTSWLMSILIIFNHFFFWTIIFICIRIFFWHIDLEMAGFMNIMCSFERFVLLWFWVSPTKVHWLTICIAKLASLMNDWISLKWFFRLFIKFEIWNRFGLLDGGIDT